MSPYNQGADFSENGLCWPREEKSIYYCGCDKYFLDFASPPSVSNVNNLVIKGEILNFG